MFHCWRIWIYSACTSKWEDVGSSMLKKKDLRVFNKWIIKAMEKTVLHGKYAKRGLKIEMGNI